MNLRFHWDISDMDIIEKALVDKPVDLETEWEEWNFPIPKEGDYVALEDFLADDYNPIIKNFIVSKQWFVDETMWHVVDNNVTVTVFLYAK